MAIYWPANLNPLAIAIDPLHRTIAGTPSLNGLTQNVASSAGIWRITYDRIGVSRGERVKAWRAVAALAEGRLNKLIVPARVYRDARAGGRPFSNVSFSDTASFDDGALFATDIDAYTVTGAAKGAATLRVQDPNDLIEPGHLFSAMHRLYVVKASTPVAGVAHRYDLSVWPPLREAVAASQTLNFRHPVCTVRLATDNEMSLLVVRSNHAAPTVTFLEDIT